MARVGVTKKKPGATALSRVKDKLRRVTEQLESRERELAEATEQQIATGEILRVIASSPTDIQPVLDAVAENAARLCDANDALIYRVDGDIPPASRGIRAIPFGQRPLPFTRGTPTGRAVIDRQTIHLHDLTTELETEFPDAKTLQQVSGTRTFLATPLLREGIPVGAIVLRRQEVRLLPTVISLSSRPSPTKLSSPSRTCGCSKSSTNRWSSKRRRVKSSASSPARLRIFSRCWTL